MFLFLQIYYLESDPAKDLGTKVRQKEEGIQAKEQNSLGRPFCSFAYLNLLTYPKSDMHFVVIQFTIERSVATFLICLILQILIHEAFDALLRSLFKFFLVYLYFSNLFVGGQLLVQ